MGMSESAGAECRRNSWLVALAGGALVALMLLIVAHYGVLKALVIGLVFAVALGVFIVWAFCSRPAEAAAPADEREPNPAPEPGPVVEPASAPAPQPERKAEAPKPSAPPAFVSAQPATRPVAAPEPVAPATAVAGQPARRKRASSAGLDAALAKSK